MGSKLFNLNSGTLYICSGGEAYVLGEVESITIAPEHNDYYDNSMAVVMRTETNAVINCGHVKWNNNVLTELLGINKYVYQQCQNKRVVYLAQHSKKKRVRKKNIKRAFRIVEV